MVEFPDRPHDEYHHRIVPVSGRATLFSLTAVPIYTVNYYFNWPLFRYYPTSHSFSFTNQPDAGPAILWYGWIAAAMAVGAVVAFAVPRRWSDRLPLDLTWMVLAIALFAVFLYEKRWFF
jgi:hypothetical protein